MSTGLSGRQLSRIQKYTGSRPQRSASSVILLPPDVRDLRGRVLGRHGLAQALGPQVGPVLLDVGEALAAFLRAEDDPPAVGDGGERRPQGVLLLVVDQD